MSTGSSVGGGSKDVGAGKAAVTAAASTPSSLTSMTVFWMILSIINDSQLSSSSNRPHRAPDPSVKGALIPRSKNGLLQSILVLGFKLELWH